MTIAPMGDTPSVLICAVPTYVRVGVAVVADEADHVVHLVRSAANIDWVSDTAALYHMRLNDVARLVASVARRAESAETAVNRLAGLT